MTSGQPLDEKEKVYILAHHKRKFPSVIARELGERFPEVNGGHRCAICIKRFLKTAV